MQVTIDLPDQLAQRLEAEKGRITEIIERGLEKLPGDYITDWGQVAAFLAHRPSLRSESYRESMLYLYQVVTPAIHNPST